MNLQILLTSSLVLFTGCYIETHNVDSLGVSSTNHHSQSHIHNPTLLPAADYLQVKIAAIGDFDYVAPIVYDQLGCQSNFGPSEQFPYIDLQESQQFVDFKYFDQSIANSGVTLLDSQLTQINNRLAQVDDMAYQLCDPSLDSITSCQLNSFSQGQFDYVVDNAYATEQIFSYDVLQFDRLTGVQKTVAHVSFYDAFKANGRYVKYTQQGIDTLSWSKDEFGDSQIIFSNTLEYVVAEEQANCSGQLSSEQDYFGGSEQSQSNWRYLQQQLQIDVVRGTQCLSNGGEQCRYDYY